VEGAQLQQQQQQHLTAASGGLEASVDIELRTGASAGRAGGIHVHAGAAASIPGELLLSAGDLPRFCPQAILFAQSKFAANIVFFGNKVCLDGIMVHQFSSSIVTFIILIIWMIR
jgi:hypothetical protein